MAAVAIDLLSRLDDDQPLREAAAALTRELVPKTSPYVRAQTARVGALLAHRSGDAAGAVSQWETAIEDVRGAGMTFHAAAIRLELLEHVPDHADVVAGLQHAVETFTGLRATPWLERARRALHAAELSALR